MTARSMAIHAIAILVALPLLVSGIQHLNNPFAFLATIYAYRILPEFPGSILAFALPAFQIALAIAMLFDFKNRKPLFGMCGGLFLIFTGAQASAWARGLDISCGCFGVREDQIIGIKSISIPIFGFLGSWFGIVVAPANNPCQGAR